MTRIEDTKDQSKISGTTNGFCIKEYFGPYKYSTKEAVSDTEGIIDRGIIKLHAKTVHEAFRYISAANDRIRELEASGERTIKLELGPVNITRLLDHNKKLLLKNARATKLVSKLKKEIAHLKSTSAQHCTPGEWVAVGGNSDHQYEPGIYAVKICNPLFKYTESCRTMRSKFSFASLDRSITEIRFLAPLSIFEEHPTRVEVGTYKTERGEMVKIVAIDSDRVVMINTAARGSMLAEEKTVLAYLKEEKATYASKQTS